jgi:hypothetical protein
MKNWFFASRLALFMFSVSSSVLFFGCVITAQIWSSLLAPSHCSDFPAGFYFGSASRPGLGRPPAGAVGERKGSRSHFFSCLAVVVDG